MFEAIALAMAPPKDCGETKTAQAPSPSFVAAEGRALRLLLAEDSRDNQMLVCAFLKQLHCTIDIADDGAIAIDKFKARKYDLVLMDVQMPVMDGLRAMKWIREWETRSGLIHTPIIALTASALEDHTRDALAAGANLHISKPVRKATLLEGIRSVTLLRSSETDEAQMPIPIAKQE